MKGQWDLDMRDNDFKEADTVYRAVFKNATKLRSLNLLTFKNDESTNLGHSLQRNRYLLNCAWFPSHSLEAANYLLEVGGCQNLCNFFFWNFQAKWVLCSCCGMLQEKIIRCESALNSFGNAPVNAVSCFAVEWPGPLRMGLCYVADQSLQVAGCVKPFSLDLKWSRNWRNLMAAEARCQVTPYS